MIYTKEFNRFFESFDTGNITGYLTEEVKINMFTGWEARQSEIDELKSRISELEDTLGRWKDKARNLSLMLNTSYGMYGED